MFLEATKPLIIETTLRLTYTDGNGKKTERIVDVQQYDEKHYGGMIIGHCHLRKDTRTFRIDRINQCVIEDTGEIIGDVRAFLREEYEKSVHASVDKLHDEQYDLLRIYLFVAKADGRMMKKEVKIIADICRELTGDERINAEVVARILNKIEVPTINAFRKAVGTMVSLPDEKRLAIIRNSESIIGTQKNISSAEQDAIPYLKKRLMNKQGVALSPLSAPGNPPSYPFPLAHPLRGRPHTSRKSARYNSHRNARAVILLRKIRLA